MGVVKQWSYHIQSYESGGKGRCITGLLEDGNDLYLGDESIWSWTTASDEELDRAMQMLNDLWMDDKLGASGRRNHDAVNLCIVLYVLGCDSPDVWVHRMKDYHVISSYDLSYFEEHVERVCEYLTKWCPACDMGQGLDYVLD